MIKLKTLNLEKISKRKKEVLLKAYFPSFNIKYKHSKLTSIERLKII